MSASFVCKTPGCYVSIILRVINSNIIEPFEINHPDTDELDEESDEDDDSDNTDSDEEEGTPEVVGPLLRIARALEIVEDVVTQKDKKETCKICNKDFIRLKTHMTRIYPIFFWV
ncbi:unnamed protein product [Brachionus calyciflorus]|uniref:Uncharacterized protein n=1 Tax=Brachionus calyciflorus TaxID=104777 RepID=A0A814CIM7_9BILA|nr:unnamed protein product [Brachionus calyciflorus]